MTVTLKLKTVSETLDEIAKNRAIELYELAKRRGWPFVWEIGNVRVTFKPDGEDGGSA